MRKSGHREMKYFLQDHKADVRWDWDLHPDLFDCQNHACNQSPPILPTSSCCCLNETVKNDLPLPVPTFCRYLFFWTFHSPSEPHMENSTGSTTVETDFRFPFSIEYQLTWHLDFLSLQIMRQI